MGGAMGPQKMKTKDAEAWNYSRSGRSPLRLLESPWTQLHLSSTLHALVFLHQNAHCPCQHHRALLVLHFHPCLQSPRSPPLPRQASTLRRRTVFKNRINFRAKWPQPGGLPSIKAGCCLKNCCLISCCREIMCVDQLVFHTVWRKERNLSHWASQREARSAPSWLQVRTLHWPSSLLPSAAECRGLGCTCSLCCLGQGAPMANSPMAMFSPWTCTIWPQPLLPSFSHAASFLCAMISHSGRALGILELSPCLGNALPLRLRKIWTHIQGSVSVLAPLSVKALTKITQPKISSSFEHV